MLYRPVHVFLTFCRIFVYVYINAGPYCARPAFVLNLPRMDIVVNKIYHCAPSMTCNRSNILERGLTTCF